MKRILILLFTYDNLDKIIDAIGKDLNIRFVYDREHLNHYKTSFKPKMSKVRRKLWEKF